MVSYLVSVHVIPIKNSVVVLAAIMEVSRLTTISIFGFPDVHQICQPIILVSNVMPRCTVGWHRTVEARMTKTRTVQKSISLLVRIAERLGKVYWGKHYATVGYYAKLERKI
jgi:hypothetical protein